MGNVGYNGYSKVTENTQGGKFMKLLTKASWSDAVTQREKDNLQIAYRAACEGIVMLKNDGALPFANKKVAL